MEASYTIISSINMQDYVKAKLPMITAAFNNSHVVLETCLIVGALALLAVLKAARHFRSLNNKTAGLAGEAAPGPKPWPILGSLHLMDGYKMPFEAFTALSKVYGSVFSITLGSSKCMVINDQKAMREVLSEKDSDFDSRPNFSRFDNLFGGDKQNSLAFCDNTTVHSKRRQILKPHTFPHAQSFNWTRLDDICQQEMRSMIDAIKSQQKNDTALVDLKTLIAKACGNIFNEYFCSTPRKSYEDPSFCNYISAFDDIFYEVNNGRAMDFLPWLKPFMSKELNTLAGNAEQVRKFVEEEVIEPKRSRGSVARRRSSADFLDGLMDFIDEIEENTGDVDNADRINKDHAMYALEDILGGHIAVASIVMRNLVDLAGNHGADSSQQVPDVQAEIQKQLSEVIGDSDISLNNKKDMHLMNAAMFESIRTTCSPIVPHQANKDSTIGGYRVEKGTVVFINNHLLNTSEELWNQPEQYNPFRFLSHDGSFKKPDHFQPFSFGRRSCMGYKIVQIVSYFIVANLLNTYTIDNATEQDIEESSFRANPEIQPGMLALPPKSYAMKLTAKQSSSSSHRAHA